MEPGNQQQYQAQVMDELRQEQEEQDQRDKMLEEQRKQDAQMILQNMKQNRQFDRL